MRIRFGAAAVLTLAIALLGHAAARFGLFGAGRWLRDDAQPASRPPDPNSTPVLVELFTSEGCSSCPPADALLSRLGRTQPVARANVITLEEHVDYWDDQGWRDPFSSEAATARQREYAQAFGGKEIYTPQMIVDGGTEFVGSSDHDALRAIGAAVQTPKPAVHVSWQERDALAIHVDPLPNVKSSDTVQVFLALAEDMLHSDVKRGENAGHALEHNGVVRQLALVAQIASAREGFSSTVAVHAAREWNRSNLRAVVFVQERRSRHILAAASIRLPSE